jgi:lysophospholipase L1-like esterase
MSITHDEYNRLVRQIEQLGCTAKVILLYNPSGYEIYRDILIGSHQEFDEVAAFQVDVQRAFAAAHGWGFMDLTEPLRNEIRDSQAWIYGRYDGTHWSPQGTAIVAAVLARELSKAMGQP